MEINITDSYTEIYIGGGNFITEASPTNFHSRYTRKILTASEMPEDFMEVTAAEMERIEAADAKWQRPPQSFIDLWNAACGSYGKYNEATGYFELNGLTDITYWQAVDIYSVHDGSVKHDVRGIAAQPGYLNPAVGCRTLLPFRTWLTGIEANALVTYNDDVEVLCFHSDRSYDAVALNGLPFSHSSRLRSIIGNAISFGGKVSISMCPELEQIHLRLVADVSIPDSPKLNFDSVAWVTKDAKSPKPVTFTVHPDVFAKLTGDTANAAAAALTPEELAAWTALPELAAEKNIQFALAA